MPPDFSFKLDLPGSVGKKHIHFITCCALFAYQHVHEPDCNVGPLFLAAAQISAANPSASCHLLKLQMHKHDTSQRGPDRATGTWFLC